MQKTMTSVSAICATSSEYTLPTKALRHTGSISATTSFMPGFSREEPGGSSGKRWKGRPRVAG
jgi:hypothetical protein